MLTTVRVHMFPMYFEVHRDYVLPSSILKCGVSRVV